MYNKLRSEKGFTVVEVIIVVIIVAVLSFLISSFVSLSKSATINGSFSNAPAGGTIISLSPASGTTDNSGNIVVSITPHVDYRGGGNIWAKDVKSGIEDSPVHFSVTGP